jgi:3-hydroxyacyl-CoA dehydrogenase
MSVSMSDPVHLSIDDGIALITIDNPPVNVTSRAVREGLMAALDGAQAAGVGRV